MISRQTSAEGNIYLIGYMASGKTTFGRALAGALGRTFVDLDDYISRQTGMSVSEIFAKHGEARFRQLEREAIETIANAGDGRSVVACGGGTPCFGDNMTLLNSAGLTVWLDATISTIMRRLREDRGGRPLVAKLDGGGELEAYVADNLRKREPYYSRAHVRFDSSRLENEAEIAESVEKFLKLLE